MCFIFPPARRDHPRLRGEQRQAPLQSIFSLGSPPLARGTEPRYSFWLVSAGITPACAGNSEPAIKTTSSAKDHPRLRGEQEISAADFSYFSGSPPLARGTVSTCIEDLDEVRITPACAGNSSCIILAVLPLRDHPRLRGEQQYLAILITRLIGSPPLARGTDIGCQRQ